MKVTNYRRTLSRKIVTVEGTNNPDDAVTFAMSHTGETYGSLFSIFTTEAAPGIYVVTLCTD